MTIRSELETRLATYAATHNPIIPIAWEGLPFTPPTSGVFLQPIMLRSNRVSPSVDASSVRVRGDFQVNVVVRDGVGSALADTIAEEVMALYPIIPKIGTVSVEQPPQKSSAILLLDKRIIAVTVNYRQEI